MSIPREAPGKTSATRPCRVRDPACHRDAILQVATRVFAEPGFAGAPIREITQRAGVNPPAIYYHFGSKEGLYAAVKRRLLAACQRVEGPADPESGQPYDPASEVRRLFESLRDSEALPRICSWSRLEEDAPLATCERELAEPVRRAIARAQAQHTVRPDLDPDVVTILLVGLVRSWLDVRSRVGHPSAGAPDEPAYLHQVIALLEQGISTDPGPA